MKKKILAAALALSMCLGLWGCGDKKEDSTGSANNGEPASQSANNDEPTSQSANSGNTEAYTDNYQPKAENLAGGASAGRKENLSYNSGSSADTSVEDGVYAGDYSEMSRASLKLFRTVLDQGKAGENVLLSPYSIDEALGMTAHGAAGTTRTEMEKVMGGDVKLEHISPSLCFLTNQMEKDEEVSWNVANSIWINSENQVLTGLSRSYLDEVGKYYSPEIYSLPFDEAAGDEINAWVNHNTDGMIQKIIDGRPDGSMHLINAVAFDGEWAVEYEETAVHEDQDFTNADGSVSKVNMLSSEESSYFELNKGLGFIKYYKGYNYAFVGILPPEGQTAEDYIRSLTDANADLSKAFLDAKSGTVHAKMPEFETEYGNELSEELQAAGMASAFSPSADFSNFNGSGGLSISSVIHKTYIDVNRKGTRAAAVTDVAIKETAIEMDEPVIITLDRPFVYAIVDGYTGTPLFLGIQNTMN